MKKIVTSIVCSLLVVGGIFMAYEVLIVSKRSPKATAELHQGSLDIKVDYCSPAKRGRLLFGEKSAGALIPYGKYWRLGANAATAITFAHDVAFAGQPVTAGSYRMYAVPGATSWQVILNSAASGWGAGEPDHAKDVVTVEVPVTVAPNPSEQFTISFAAEPPAAKLDFTWDGTLVRVPIAAR